MMLLFILSLRDSRELLLHALVAVVVAAQARAQGCVVAIFRAVRVELLVLVGVARRQLLPKSRLDFQSCMFAYESMVSQN